MRVTTEKIVFGGKALARVDGKTVFIPFALPDEELDITVTPELEREGIARELVNRIQNIRKANNYEITDKIAIKIEANEHIDDTITEFGSYISSQVLANSLERVEKLDDFEALDFDDYMVNIKVERI